jgi:uncharacterized protein YndB with AHSA1/START domain
MTTPQTTTEATVLKTITVKASAEHAFEVFTEGIDSWWPRTHHIGSSPMKKTIIEGRVGGRCYSEQVDGSECDWGSVLVWDPPRRFVMAWQITATWKFEPDIAKSSEVEVRFTPEAGGSTRVDLEHRGFERMGEGGESMKAGVGGPGGWSGVLAQFVARIEATPQEQGV